MKITQVFGSSSDSRLISEIEFGGTGQSVTIPITGDNVRWIVEDKVYGGSYQLPPHFVERRGQSRNGKI